MKLAIFQLLIVLFTSCSGVAMGQTPDNTPVIEFSATDFLIERPFTISVTLPNSETRPVIAFPEIAGLRKSGTTGSVATSEINGKSVVSQIITQNYVASAPGRYVLAPFAITVKGIAVRSPGTTLTVKAAPGKTSPSVSTTVALAQAEKGGAFLSLTASHQSIYVGEGVLLRLTFYAAENYPYELRFEEVDRQLQTITKQIRPSGAWEENAGINELKPRSLKINGRPFREFILYQSTFYPLRSQTIRLPAVTLTMQQIKTTSAPTTIPAAPVSVTQTQPISFASQPVTIDVKPLPARSSADLMPVGTFRLVDELARSVVSPGQSIAYEFRIEGEGNIAALPPPTIIPGRDVDVFPPAIHQVINRAGNPVTGQKSFRYFLLPKQNGTLPLASLFQWVYFNSQTARYDTLRSDRIIRVGGQATPVGIQLPDSAQAGTLETDVQHSIYTGIGQIDSTYQPLNFPVLVRAVANVLIVVLLLSMVYIFFKK